MELPVSSKTKRTAKQFMLTPEQLAFADLIAAGWQAEDAFFVAFRKGMTWMKNILTQEVDKLLNDENVVRRIESVKGIVNEEKVRAAKNVNKTDRDAIVDAAMSKEQMLYDLQTAIVGMKAGSKEWLDTKKLIVEVTRMKQEDVAKDDTTIHYFLPAQYPTSCKDCLFSQCDSCKYKKAVIEQ